MVKMLQIEPHNNNDLCEIFQSCTMKFAFLDKDMTTQVVAGCKCRDFLTDAIWVDWGKAQKASIYGFTYNRNPPIGDHGVILCYNIPHMKAFDARIKVIPNIEKVHKGKVGETACRVVVTKGWGDTTFGVSMITLLLRCTQYRIKDECKTLDDLLTICKKDQNGTDSRYCSSILEKTHVPELVVALTQEGLNIQEIQKRNDTRISTMHNNGGIWSLATGLMPGNKGEYAHFNLWR